ncbi:MAG TPA: N-methyl-L-tryptophan oxidase [Methylomirabilota bacterium]|nr:N-methyl-L-tryptophan oxidase [Methylomirabilota bacterium]
MTATFDVAVIGAGVFGAWTAWHLAKRGRRVVLLESYGPAHNRASSGGETRIIRMSYGPDEIYTRWAQRSLTQWKQLFANAAEKLFLQTGVLWMAGEGDVYLQASIANLQGLGVKHELLNRRQLESRYTQVNFENVACGMLETESGVLMARRAVNCVVESATRAGVEFRVAQIEPPHGGGPVESILTHSGERISAGSVVFACGPWLGKLFPELLGPRIFPTRQEVFFFGCPPGDNRFAPPSLPTWLFQGDEMYGMPDIESRGLKIALDRHGERVDPDTQSRLPTSEALDQARKYVARRFPALKDAPIAETRVCQYENTSNGDFLIDRHPDIPNAWLAGGGSGHGFKHGPAVGEYVAARVLGEGTAEPRFSLESKATEQRRSVH